MDVPHAAEAASGAAVPIVNETDYLVENVQYDPDGLPGQQLSGTPYQFTVKEDAGVEGNRKVNYVVYASPDTILDDAASAVPDPILKSGFIQANDIGAGGSYVVAYDDPGILWPLFPAHYYIIITIDAADDVNPSNDTLISGPVTVPDIFIELPDNGNNDYNDGYYDVGPPPADPTADHHNLDADLQTGELRTNELIHITGIMDVFGEFDTYGFTAGPGMTRIEATAEWATGFDDIDLYYWSEGDWDQSVSIRTITDFEGIISIYNMVPGNRYYIGVNFWLNGNTNPEGAPYTLIIKGLP